MNFESIKRKIKNPPAVQNLVRLIDINDETKTTLNVANFALSIPSFNYVSGTKMCVDRVRLGLGLETALTAIAKVGSPEGRPYNADFVSAFFEYDDIRGYSQLISTENYQGQYRISRDINVPTSPTFTVIEHGRQVPVVLCGWKDLPLLDSQIRMWMTMLESGLFSFGDYRHSPADVLIFPEQNVENKNVRRPYIVKRGDVRLFTESDMREIVAMYARAQEAAMPIAESRWHEREQRRKQKDISIHDIGPMEDSIDLGQPDLFAGFPKKNGS